MSAQSRTVILSRHPRRHIEGGEFRYLICPGDIAARQLGFPPVSLDEIARQALEANGTTIAPEHVVLRVVASILTGRLNREDCGGMARALLPAINTLFRSGADLGRTARLTNGRPRLIAETAHTLRRHLLETDYCAKSCAITHVVEQQDIQTVPDSSTTEFKFKKIPRLAVFGYPRLNEMEFRLADHLAGPGSCIYLPYLAGDKLFGDNETAAHYLENRGWSIQVTDDCARTAGQQTCDAFLGLNANLYGVTAVSYPAVEEEVRAVLRRIKRGLQRAEFDIKDVALVARTESSYGEIVREIAWEYEMPVVTHYSVPLLETRAGQWLSALVEICENADYPFEATARLIQHALGAKLAGDSWSADAWKEALREHARGATEWDRLGAAVGKTVWPMEATRKEWCDRLRETMRELELRKLSMRRAQDLTAYEKLYESLEAFSLPSGENLSRADFVSQLRDLLRVTSVPSDTSGAGLEVHTPLSLYGASVKHLFVLGEAEGELPRPIADDAMLDFHDRRELETAGIASIESAAQAARRETLSFYSLLLAAGESLTFSYPRMEGSAVVRPSPFIGRMGLKVEHRSADIDIAASRSELIRHEMQAPEALRADPLARYAANAAAIVRRREAAGTPDAYSGCTDEPLSAHDHAFSPSQLTAFGQCSYKWFAQSLMHLGDLEEAEDDLAPSLKGLLYHAVLDRLLKEHKDAPNVRTAMIADLERVFDEISAEKSEVQRLVGWRSRRNELMTQLRSAIEGDSFLMPDARVHATEHAFDFEWKGLRVRGRLDRIDRTPEGRLVIDYKTSGSPPKGAKDQLGRLNLDVQLPIYLAYGRTRTNGTVDGYYYSLTKGEVLKPPTGDPSGLDQLAAEVKSAMASGEYPVNPDGDEDACKYCELDILCRKGPHLFRNRVPST